MVVKIPTIYINGKAIKSPAVGLELVLTTNVDSGRNANGEVVGQVVGRNVHKINNLQWAMLTAEEWSEILAEFDDFFCTVRFPDMRNNNWVTHKCYPGDRTAEPFWLNKEPGEAYGLPTHYRNCKVNLIDCGIISEDI